MPRFILSYILSRARAYTAVKHVSVLQLLVYMSCTHDHLPSRSTGGHDYIQVNLVADTAGYGAARIDTALKNPWGISIGATGRIWLGVNGSGSTAVYDMNGKELIPAVAIPYRNVRFGSSPTGTVFNTTTDFAINGQATRFLFCTEEGLITIWGKGDTTVTVADMSAKGAVYKGLAIGVNNGSSYIYAADFYNAKVDVFDKTFSYVATGYGFNDPGIPAGYAPFNIKNIGGLLYILYAKQGADKKDDERGTGNGYVSVFTTGGALVRRFATRGALNSPWGITALPATFGQGSDAMLIGNFGDGSINVYDTSGNFRGQLGFDGMPIIINGLWEITFSPTSTTQLFFAAGPDEERHGLFGYIKMK